MSAGSERDRHFAASCAADRDHALILVRFDGDKKVFSKIGGLPALLEAARALKGLTPPRQRPPG
jgi:hypothetical protein